MLLAELIRESLSHRQSCSHTGLPAASVASQLLSLFAEDDGAEGKQRVGGAAAAAAASRRHTPQPHTHTAASCALTLTLVARY